MSLLPSTFYMIRYATLVTRDASTTLLVARLTHFVISGSCDGGNAFAGFQCFGTPKPDLGGPNGACDVNPIVICSPLEWFSRVDGPVEILLPLAVILGCLSCLLNLDSFTFTIFIRHLLLVMRELRLFDKILLGDLYRA